MATYTDNYQLTKPTYAEQADIGVINSNMNKIDNIMHSSQISLADAYDSTKTYAEGDVVMYELLMYKCISPTTGVWDASKWERTTASESGGGGSAELDILGEASGAVASFADGASAELAKCIADVNPKQDLHGYSKPWAGGAGKNKLPITATSQTVQGVTFTVNSNGTISLSGTATGRADFVLSTFSAYGGNYTISGAPQNGSAKWNLRIDLTSAGETNQCYDDGTSTSSPTMNTPQGTQIKAVIRVYQGVNTNGLIFKPMLEQGTSATTFEPYSNICPISGSTSVTVTVSDGETSTTKTTALGQTVYGGQLNVLTGDLTITNGYIASYNGETLPSTWISDRDEYAPNTSPTTGAQVVYTLATPQTVQLTPQKVNSLLGQNNISADTGDVDIVYVKASAPIQPNPTGTPTATLKKLGIEGAVFEVPSGGGGSSEEVYDNTERTSGTYFGKPRYRISFTVNAPSGAGTHTIATLSNYASLGKVIKIEGSLNNSNYSWTVPYADRNIDAYFSYDKTTGNINFIVKNDDWSGYTIDFTIYYTKITD